jgi:hypothetical protein
MPRDFYREKGDRDMPTAKEIMEHKVQRNQVAVNTYRLLITPRVARYASIAAFVVAGVGYASLGSISALYHAHAVREQQAEQVAKTCQIYKTNHITPLPTECQ